MNSPIHKTAVYADLFDLPDNVVGEILNNQLITHPRPSPRHSLAAMALSAMIASKFDRNFTDGPGGWWILNEPECHLANDVVVPDIAGWRQLTMPDLPDSAWIDITPDWVCEIASPSTQKYDRSVKRDIYAREQVPYYWIVDPVYRLIEVFALHDGSWTLLRTVKDDMTVSLEPFEVIPFDIGRLWV